jgi:hypothetical protein
LSLLAITILGVKLSGSQLLVGALVVLIIVGAVGLFVYTRRPK